MYNIYMCVYIYIFCFLYLFPGPASFSTVMSVGRPLGDKAYGCGGGTHVKGYINDWMGIVERVIYTVSGFNLYLLVILCFFSTAFGFFIIII